MAAAIIDTFTASDGYAFHYRRYEPTGEPRGIVIGIHGIQSHGGWYEHSCQKLSAGGYRVFYLDRRGSGLNGQARGDTPSFGRLLEDLSEFLRGCLGLGTGGKRTLPIFLMAVSWGGKLAVGLQRWQDRLTDGLVLLCPGLFPQVGLPFGERLAILGTRITSPTQLCPIPLNVPELFTASEQWREFIRKDPLALREATARFLVESVRLDSYLRRAPTHVTVPTLLLLAGQDRIIRNDKTHHYFHRFATDSKNVITYRQAHHTLEFEPDPDRFLTEIVNWLDCQCRTGTPRPAP